MDKPTENDVVEYDVWDDGLGGDWLDLRTGERIDPTGGASAKMRSSSSSTD